MSKLIELLDRITEFGENPNVKTENKELIICKLLTDLYSEYLNLENIELDDKNYDDESRNFDSAFILQNIKENFPKFGWYHSVWDSHKIIQDADVNTGDAIDDLLDIIKDMMEVKWIIKNQSLANGLWQFNFSMKYHSEQHLVNFLKYAKDLKG